MQDLTISLQDRLFDANEKCKKYEWLQAADVFRKALEASRNQINMLDRAKITESVANSYFKAAFQSKDNDEFRRIMRLSRDAYDNSAQTSQSAGLDIAHRRMVAKKLFTEYWLAPSGREMVEVLKKCVEMSRETVQQAEKTDAIGFLYACEDELSYLVEYLFFYEDWTFAKQLFDRATTISDIVIDGFQASSQDLELLESLYLAIFLYAIWGPGILPVEQFKELEKKTLILGERIDALSKRMGTAFANTLRSSALCFIAYGSQGDPAKALRLLEEGFESADTTGDTLFIGRLQGTGTVMATWIDQPEDPELERSLLQKGMEYGTRAVSSFNVSAHPYWLSWAYAFWAECYLKLGRFVETELEKKKVQVQKATEIAKKGTEYDTDNWTPSALTLSKCLYLTAKWSQDSSQKKTLLMKALPLRERQARLADMQFPHSFDLAVVYNYLALVKSELSKVKDDPGVMANFLHGAISAQQKSLEVGSKWPTPDRIFRLATFQEQYGDLLLQRYILNHDKIDVLDGVKAYQEAIHFLEKQGFTATLAAVSWKIGSAYETIGDYRKSSDAFGKAADDYEHASKSTISTANAFEELASYMRAWTYIQDARYYHAEDQFSKAGEKYLEAAKTLLATKPWSHLASHYEACAFLEKSETESKEERHEESVQSFQSAIDAFHRSEQELEAKRLDQSLTPEEKHELENWLQITRGRERYAGGRLDVEVAVVLDAKGEDEASSGKYQSASEIFGELMEGSPGEQSRREFEVLTHMCDAWAKMKKAEIKVSPELYSEASQSFKKAQAATASNRFRLLALANSSMCQALEAGTRFRHTRDSRLYSEIKKNLETTADYYTQARQDKAADWTRATQRLFDAFVYLSSAETELETKKKAELYHLAEKYLQLAAKLYEKAGYPSKREEALKHLGRAKEEKELLLTPIEALADSPAAAAIDVAPVSLLRDRAVGLERFDAAQVVGHLGLQERECGVGADLTLDLEFANIGKAAATLIKMERIAPEGLEVKKESGTLRFQDNNLDLNGKRLGYMKSQEVKVSLKAKRKGTFEIRPRILFVDESGNYKSYDFEPQTLTVKELGIGGWLKGPK